MASLRLMQRRRNSSKKRTTQTTPETGTQPVLSAAGDSDVQRARRVACVPCERGREGAPASWRIFGGARGPERVGGLQEAIDFRHRRTRRGVLMTTSDSFKRSVIPRDNNHPMLVQVHDGQSEGALSAACCEDLGTRELD